MSIEDKTNDETEELEEFLSELTEKDFQTLIHVVSQILKVYGDFVFSFGTIENEYSDFIIILEKLGYFAPTLMGRFIEEAPPEIVRDFMKTFIKLFFIFPKLGKLMELEPNEKIKLGKDLIELADDFQAYKKLIGEER